MGDSAEPSPSVREPESFRDSIPTADHTGRRRWVYPRKPPCGSGAPKTTTSWYRLRTWFSWFLLILMFVGPFIRINGNPLLMFNVVERKFSIFGRMFWPQDLNIFAMMMVLGFFMITVFTAVFGRLWCGWACPQTVLLEMVFRKIEYWIEGDAHKQRRLNEQPMNPGKLRKKVLKHSIFFALSFIIGNWLLMYVIGSGRWVEIVTDNPFNHLQGLTSMIIFSLVFYGIFARFREQACTFVCPYGRFQSVMLDEQSMVVAYDDVRGEGRGKTPGVRDREQRKVQGFGDCVDCGACVAVCPTGIDIRNGIQMECVNCTNCIDACNVVMEKLNFPTGLIRYASLDGIKEQRSRWNFTPRLKAYCALLVLLFCVLVYLLASHRNIEVAMFRAENTLYQTGADGTISNLYTLELLNKTNEPQQVKLALVGVDGQVEIVGGRFHAEPQAIGKSAAFIRLHPAKAHLSENTKLRIGVYSEEGKLLHTLRTTFVAPEGTAS